MTHRLIAMIAAASLLGCGKSSSETGAAPTPSEAQTEGAAAAAEAAAPDAAVPAALFEARCRPAQ